MLEAGFHAGVAGRLFHVLHLPETKPAARGVLYVHPFAEEMNKSRRMAALQARRLAAAGWAVLVPDHYGCGDSAGDFRDSRWEIWVEDLAASLRWLAARYAEPPVVWGLRTGCLLLGEAVEQSGVEPAAATLWQPVVRGEPFLTQFLRLRMAAGLLEGKRETTRELRAALEAGEAVEVAGYALHPGLAAALGRVELQPPPGAVHWIDVVPEAEGGLPPVSRRAVDRWLDAGVDVTAEVVCGEPFWSTQEIQEVPDLLERTTRWHLGNQGC